MDDASVLAKLDYEGTLRKMADDGDFTPMPTSIALTSIAISLAKITMTLDFMAQNAPSKYDQMSSVNNIVVALGNLRTR
jgi:hypothetical protein